MQSSSILTNLRKGEFDTANAGRFTDSEYSIKLDNETAKEFGRDHVLEVIEHAVNAGIHGVKSSREYKDVNNKTFNVSYPHVFHNIEGLRFKLYKAEDGPLYEYPIIKIAGNKLSFGPTDNPQKPMDPLEYRVVYTINAANVGILQGLIGHKYIAKKKTSSPFLMCPQFHAQWDPAKKRIVGKSNV
ncbi:unnamed protein product [Rhizoctonia solani]|uniref:Uncharacterized protein n=1 Tax=Rhizoctonia solani TaxID=456999 RepID=A0A8H2W944_9AGAM|nr:unnamed protein product [Rhizoctonia solani]